MYGRAIALAGNVPVNVDRGPVRRPADEQLGRHPQRGPDPLGHRGGQRDGRGLPVRPEAGLGGGGGGGVVFGVPETGPRRGEQLRRAEIGNLGVELAVEQHVVGLEVAVHNLERVQVCHPVGNLLREPNPDLPAQRAGAIGQHVPERPQRHVLGHHERPEVGHDARTVEDQQSLVAD